MIPTPKTLKPVKVPKKPIISINPIDRFRHWLNNSLTDIISAVIKSIVPTWVYLSFLGFLIALVIGYMVTK